MVNPFGLNYHDFVFISINNHTHIRALIMKDINLFSDILMASHQKNNAFSIKEKSNDHTNEVGARASWSFQIGFKTINVKSKKFIG